MAKNLIQRHSQILTLNRDPKPFQASLCFTVSSLASLQQQVKQFLHPDELPYWNNLSFPKRQQTYLLGRYCIKQAVVQYYPSLSMLDAATSLGVFGYPIIHTPGNQKIQATLSHCQDMGVALVFPEEHPMGIDLETLHADKNPIIDTQLTPDEKRFIQECKHTSIEHLPVLFWTIKEALSKVLRTGMMTPFDIYAVTNLERHSNHWTSEFNHFAQYQAMSFLVGNHICSIVYPKKTKLCIDIQAIQDWMANLTLPEFIFSS